MPLIDNENDVKRDTLFPEYEIGESGNLLILKSKLYKVTTHFLKPVNKYVLCRGAEECLYCQAYYPKLGQFYYAVDLNGVSGFLDIKASVFYNIQGISRAQKKDARSIIWTVIKQGSGIDTEYMTSKCDNLPAEDFEKIQAQLQENTDRLVEYVEGQEERLDENYIKHISDIKQQTPPKGSRKSTKEENKAALEAQAPAAKREEEIIQDEAQEQSETSTPVDPSQDVQPGDIPF